VPLNEDVLGAIPDDEYWARCEEIRVAAEAAEEPACGDAPPPDVIADVVAQLKAGPDNG
jgi:hypothetical protein